MVKAYYERSQTRNTPAERRDDLRQAKLLTNDVLKMPDNNDVKAKALVELAHALVHWANFSKEPEDDKTKALIDAVDYAKQGRNIYKNLDKLSSRSGLSKSYFLTALGNAYEDLAWLVEHHPTDNYKLAIQYFEEAKEEDKSDDKADRSHNCLLLGGS